MQSALRSYIDRELLSGAFSSRARVWRFAVKLMLVCIVIANCADMAALSVLHHFGLLPYSLSKAIHTGLLMTTTISIAVGLPILYVVCVAIHDLSTSRDAFARLSRTDTLTGLLNRRAFLEAFEASSGARSLVLFDIDRFKSVNDTYGHDIGDKAIMSVARTLEGLLGEGQAIGRIGGEEFAVLVEGATPEERFAIADRARLLIAEQAIDLGDGRSIRITISGGVAAMAARTDFGTVFAVADKALYLAKISGRNRVIDARDLPHAGFSSVAQPLNGAEIQAALGA